MQHTPGPWLIGDVNTDESAGVLGEVAILAKTEHTAVGYCCPAVALPFLGPLDAAKMAMANAHLIAAAPKLLEALQYARRFLTRSDKTPVFSSKNIVM